MMQDGRAVVDQRGAMSAHPAVDGDIIVGDLLRRRQQNFAQVIRITEFAAGSDIQQFVHRPSQIDRRRSGGFQQVASFPQVRD